MPLEAMEMRELTDDELAEELTRAKDEIARLRYRAAFEELENPSLLKTLRREIARLKTVQVERTRSEENQVG
ncbi:MAG: 50S ribosomal protein L29 [Gemmatimonadota bacterium]|uniref:50S ribosomal protein L29 n=1 Tax=Candidatus Palauibacter scopulicola TaxID=3056741 RepID=UPI00238DFC52|nr:50S ribosomal protein L29 [Candidatus Palauibacter scopulicola]MDE2663302.1 50S ribosomal protein L29 [Candidatus Palauibacter scopulicola]